MWNIEIEDGEQLSGMCQAAVMTVITDRVTFVEKLVEYRESWSRCGGWTYMREGRGGKEKEEAEDRLGPAVTKYPGSRGRNKSKIVSSMGSKEGKEGTGEEKPIFGNRYYRCRFAETDPFTEPTYFSRRQNSHCCPSS